MKATIKLIAAIGAALASAGCQTVPGDYDKPARIVNNNDASRAALQEAVNDAFGTNVILADNALTDTSILTIERSPRPSMENLNPLGRNMEMPLQLRLYINGTDCILVDQRDRSRRTLANTTCEAE